MNKAQIQCLCVFSVFAVIGFGPVSPGCLIGMYVVAMRPAWFQRLLDDLYAGKPLPPGPVSADAPAANRLSRKRCFLGLLGLFIIDIAPAPVTPAIAFIIIFSRPAWFYRLWAAVYAA